MGPQPADLAFIVGVSGMHPLLADTTLLTVDKMGPNATILNGQVGTVYGVPVIASEYAREDLNTSGVYDTITTTKTYNLCVSRRECAIGQRMALDVEVGDSIYRETFQRVLAGFAREDVQHRHWYALSHTRAHRSEHPWIASNCATHRSVRGRCVPLHSRRSTSPLRAQTAEEPRRCSHPSTRLAA